ncbi:sulfate transporter [Penicillium coprophilum]|uniref:sulfate transporter n=1 Tax=Penicillium coprophilum TaxID=36646 RepID=UPI00238E84AB|nr:sulfate transporter [Penicillium coprophilum]KAJ5155038.1 sulfate transporter [Penicillium coprophilum]
MSETSSLLPGESDGPARRTIRDRIVDAFRSSPQTGLGISTNSSHGNHTTHDNQTGTGVTSEPDARTRLLESYLQAGPACGERHCSHGTFSPQIGDVGRQSYLGGSGDTSGYNGHEAAGGAAGRPRGVVDHPESVPDSETPSQMKSSFTFPITDTNKQYISYYIPFLNWIQQYHWSFLRGDLMAALTVASIYIPMALSLASNLAHAPPISGLYSFVIHPMIYAILGSCPLLVVGPEAAGSLLTGAIVKASVMKGISGEDDLTETALIVGVATAMSGGMILIAGLTRLGFLDNVLSRPFLRGFITAIGFVIFVDQLIPELGLAEHAKESGVSHGTSVEKLIFIIRNARECHGLTAIVSIVSFTVIMVFRTLKKMLVPRIPQVIYFPDRFLVVALSAVLAWQLDWEGKGLEILGPTEVGSGGLFAFNWPFQFAHMKHVRTALSKSFIIALLGFFESSVAAKGLGEGNSNGIKGMFMSANREMVALGVANVVGGCFSALPAFGGYGRSKLSSQTGARSPMTSVFLSIITFTCVMVLLPYLYYLPKAVLCSMISVVAFTLVEECPHDLLFFIRLRGWSEIVLMLLIFTTTIFYSLELGMAMGMGLSVIILIRHATHPRIQILGKVLGTAARFDNAELHPENVELVEGALIVKIPEPLTFANTGDLKNRLRRLELYGSSHAHPSLPRMRAPEHNKNIIFDVHGVTSIDGSGTQVLSEIVHAYAEEHVRVFFCRVPNREVFRMFERSGIVENCGGLTHFVPSVDEALRLAESENQTEEI